MIKAPKKQEISKNKLKGRWTQAEKTKARKKREKEAEKQRLKEEKRLAKERKQQEKNSMVIVSWLPKAFN